ncbi:LOW QUALITY PROTEIN: sodium channel subunit beta-4 [Orycteropus afer afer]|uniref:Sodium channel regulatory subunit beta-4 n=1 Tax=Orycteropus afer afer TaxID=1230840 RepID=A0A8B6ZGK1_ORYAF|nr:LOW QUALITY PROTEIN: sodium channel subunit beta-4 [Orycteropus afer afer]
MATSFSPDTGLLPLYSLWTERLLSSEVQAFWVRGLCFGRLFLFPVSLSLEVSVGKATTIYAVNGTEILLPCTFSSCFGFENLQFWWSYNGTGTSKTLIEGTVKNEKSDPKVKAKKDDRITLVGSTKEKVNNISILLKDLDFSDTGKYTCRVKNPKEKDLEHQATIFLQVVDKLEEVDNTVTLIILAVVGGIIGSLIFILLLKKFITFILKKTREKKKECLVSSSGNDNTENGLPGSKAEEKPPTKVLESLPSHPTSHLICNAFDYLMHGFFFWLG